MSYGTVVMASPSSGQSVVEDAGLGHSGRWSSFSRRGADIEMARLALEVEG